MKILKADIVKRIELHVHVSRRTNYFYSSLIGMRKVTYVISASFWSQSMDHGRIYGLFDKAGENLHSLPPLS